MAFPYSLLKQSVKHMRGLIFFIIIGFIIIDKLCIHFSHNSSAAQYSNELLLFLNISINILERILF